MEVLAKRINKEIKESSLFKQYILLKGKVSANQEIESLKKELDLLKREICVSKDEGLLKEYYEKENQYLNNPLVKEYLNVKEELECLLKDIVDILSFN